ncbi:MAG: hypothetical protein ABI945_09535 [Nitrospirales bacterium]
MIVSEHLPTGDKIVPNLDTHANWDIRAVQKSGVLIDQPPFNCKSETLLELDPDHKGYEGSIIRTSLIESNLMLLMPTIRSWVGRSNNQIPFQEDIFLYLEEPIIR